MRASPLPRSFLILPLAALAGGPALAAPQCFVEWQASSGLLPDQASPPWDLQNSSSGEPVLGSELTLCTTEFGDNMYYGQSDFELDLPPSG